MQVVTIPANLIERHRVVDETMLAQIITHISSGSTVIEIVSVYPLSRVSVYKWLRKAGVSPEKVEKTEISPVQTYSYYYFINKEYKAGRLDKQKKNRIMSNFYAHKDNAVQEVRATFTFNE